MYNDDCYLMEKIRDDENSRFVNSKKTISDLQKENSELKNKLQKLQNILNGEIKIYAVALDGDIIGCDYLEQAKSIYTDHINVHEYKEAYIIEAVATKKLWKKDPKDTQYESAAWEEETNNG